MSEENAPQETAAPVGKPAGAEKKIAAASCLDFSESTNSY
jgi:hypothetical protein